MYTRADYPHESRPHVYATVGFVIVIVATAWLFEVAVTTWRKRFRKPDLKRLSTEVAMISALLIVLVIIKLVTCFRYDREHERRRWVAEMKKPGCGLWARMIDEVRIGRD